MTKWDFMRKLEELLFEISPMEREEALQYYNDYINDAGKENEAEVLASLGTPEQVAEIVKSGLDGNASGMFTEHGYENKTKQFENSVVSYHEKKTNYGEKESSQSASGNTKESKSKMSAGIIVLIVILCIFGAPIILGVGSSLLGVITSVIIVIFSVFLVTAVLTIVFFIASVALVIAGFSVIFTLPFLGIGLIGSGCIVACLAVLCMLATAALFGKALPALFRGIAGLFQRVFHRRGGTRA